MSSPSNFQPRLSIAVAPRQQNKKIISAENSIRRQFSNNSNEDYHGGEHASVPFTWESRPGTPKVKFRETSLPPLTPPPSYCSSANKRPMVKLKKSPKSSIFQTIFPKRSTRKGRIPSVPASPASPSMSCCSSSSCSSSHSSSPRPASRSVPSSPMIYTRKKEEDEDLYDAAVSSLCFGNVRSRGCYSGMIKKVLLGDLP